jgi:formylglycine-generating enzyme required for sulfatase activity
MKHIRMAFTLLCIFALFNLAAADDRSMRRNVPLTSSTGQTTPLYKDSYALVVGNGAYKGGFDPLRGALRDVKDVAIALEKQGFVVTLKTDLTLDGFMTALNEFVLVHGKSEENRLLFYYAGHGYTQKMANDEDLGYLVMIDAPDPDKDPMGFRRSSVDMQTLITQAKMIRSKHVLFMFDSCFSGTVLDLRERITPQSITDSVRNPVRQFITAGRANEPVPDQSVFKQAFLDLLEGRDKEPIPDGYITGEELGLYLKTKVPYYNPSQHPQYGRIRDPRLDKGDFVFLASGQAVVDKPQPVIGGGGTLVAGGPGPVSKPKPATGPKAGDIWTDPVTGMVFVWVPGDCYQMGCGYWTSNCSEDENPVHEVCLDGFWMGQTEVTQGQWQRVMGSNPSSFQKGDNHPVEKVSWDDTKEYIRKLNSKGSAKFRLPSEAEWEYAARSGGKAEKYSGGGDLDSLAWHDGNSGKSTHPVKTKKGNGLGIYDMSGNVYEWCEDIYIADIYGKSNKKNPIYSSGGPDRVIRGGSWYIAPVLVRCANRYSNVPSDRNAGVGFRLLRMP